MNTLTATLPDTISSDYALWTLAHSLYEKNDLTLQQAASLAGIAPTYFRRRLEDIKAGRFQFVQTENSLANSVFTRGNHLLNKPFDRKRFDELIEQMDIQEPLDQLLGMLTK